MDMSKNMLNHTTKEYATFNSLEQDDQGFEVITEKSDSESSNLS